MSKVFKELLREFVKEKDLKSPSDILCHERNVQRYNTRDSSSIKSYTSWIRQVWYLYKQTQNSRNGYPIKANKSKLETVDLNMLTL